MIRPSLRKDRIEQRRNDRLRESNNDRLSQNPFRFSWYWCLVSFIFPAILIYVISEQFHHQDFILSSILWLFGFLLVLAWTKFLAPRSMLPIFLVFVLVACLIAIVKDVWLSTVWNILLFSLAIFRYRLSVTTRDLLRHNLIQYWIDAVASFSVLIYGLSFLSSVWAIRWLTAMIVFLLLMRLVLSWKLAGSYSEKRFFMLKTLLLLVVGCVFVMVVLPFALLFVIGGLGEATLYLLSPLLESVLGKIFEIFGLLDRLKRHASVSEQNAHQANSMIHPTAASPLSEWTGILLLLLIAIFVIWQIRRFLRKRKVPREKVLPGMVITRSLIDKERHPMPRFLSTQDKLRLELQKAMKLYLRKKRRFSYSWTAANWYKVLGESEENFQLPDLQAYEKQRYDTTGAPSNESKNRFTSNPPL